MHKNEEFLQNPMDNILTALDIFSISDICFYAFILNNVSCTKEIIGIENFNKGSSNICVDKLGFPMCSYRYVKNKNI